MNLEEFKQVKVLRAAEGTGEVRDIKYSPDGELVAVARGIFVDIFSVMNDYALRIHFEDHTAPVTHLDFSEKDGKYLQATAMNQLALFYDLETRKKIPNGAMELRDQVWETWSSEVGWPVQGLGLNFEETNEEFYKMAAVDRTKKQTNSGYYEVAIGLGLSNVCVFRYPLLMKRADCLTGFGHSSQITNLKWANDDQVLLSTGGEDQCVFQWKLTR